MSFFRLLNTEDMFEQLLVATDYHSIFCFNNMEINGDQKLFAYPHSSKYLCLCLADERSSYMFRTTGGQIMTEFSFLGELIIFSRTAYMCFCTEIPIFHPHFLFLS